MEEKHTCVLNHDEYELLNFYRQLSEERKQKFFDLVQTLDMLLNSRRIRLRSHSKSQVLKSLF